MSDRFAVAAVAGHIDHGKTALVRRLTGVETDRLKEEKQRGISIDLGFAPLLLSEGLRLGLVDVPGHERFIRNMLAGVGGMDLALLVVAADEGIMPQTREHAAILSLLRIPRCLVVLTKSDLVDDEHASLVELEVAEFLAATGFRGAPIVRFSARTGAGEGELRSAMLRVLEGLELRSGAGPVRLPIDRVFTMEGFGTVVTGSLWNGTLRVGATLKLQPSGRTVRVRTLESHGQRAEEVGPGRRVAVSLHPLAREQSCRGDWLVAEGSGGPSRRLSVRAELLRDFPRALGARTGVRFHLGASETLAILRLLGQDSLEPGGECLAQLELRHPSMAERGDRFVLRTASADMTLGGGTVIAARAARVRAHDPGALKDLGRLEEGSPDDRILESLLGLPGSARLEDILAPSGMEREPAKALLAALAASGSVYMAGQEFVHPVIWERARGEILDEVRRHQREFPARFGMARGELRNRMDWKAGGALFDALALALVAKGNLHAREDRLALAAEEPLPESMLAGAERIRQAAREAGLGALSFSELAARCGDGGLEIANRLLFERELVRLPGDLVFSKEALEGAAATVEQALKSKKALVLEDFKGLFGLSRKYMMPLLEYLDAIGVTRREGDRRMAGRRGAGAGG